MSACTHPTSALFVDKDTNTTHCTLCGDILVNDQLELDPFFGRSTNAAAGASRGNYRPSHSYHGVTSNHARPCVDVARRGMLAIARELEIRDDIVEMALGIYKTALNVGAISGTRSAILCACLYAICRREHTSHVIYDFTNVHKDSPQTILSFVKHICEATHTQLPVADPSFLVQRFAENLNLGDQTTNIVVCALKVLRIMKDDWIACGRRPMGVCAAALLVACYMFNIPRSPEQVCGMVRLTAPTIARRLQEFAATPAAALESIDDYKPTDSTLPPAFGSSSRKTTEEDMHAEMRELSSVYYELVSEAKLSQPATPERCHKWRWFILKHCELEGIVAAESNLDLTNITAEQQLFILGLPHTKPITSQRVEESVRKEEERLLIKPESRRSESHMPINMDDPAVVERATTHYRELMKEAEVEGLRQDFDFQVDEAPDSYPYATQNEFDHFDDKMAAPSPAGLAMGSIDHESERQSLVQELLWDPDRRYALPWDIVVLQDENEEDLTDVQSYLILDNEERIRRYQMGETQYGEAWNRGRPRTAEEIQQLEVARTAKRRRAPAVTERTTAPNALERALRGRGAATINVSNIGELIPGLAEESVNDGAGMDEWEQSAL